ncbi:hypothetical protein [Pseudoteredinibacter isoporae]|uniref:Uncharacterized protein n=1 Tax=Pseudoteredinibacter isoporae TaxID=570281 RepID=A0A7X0MXA0_9GAMM|nr:hypothetical protein [Pseudoteredinibacter isoporae]MBB6523263.1 hypothetical protein [Pseudoteredinibacter isoporae]NHO88779.1 hypothetical protein [Pseudoteredinibacter isoporae]NIB22530.1 hypothetical protein [Pseudoteredinibacter isoporae]
MLLRKQLESISQAYPRHQQWAYLERLAQYNEHNIRPVADPWPEHNYTCLVFALGLTNSRVYQQIVTRNEDVFAGPEFALFLISQGALKSVNKPQCGDLVLYSTSHERHYEICHAGLVEEDGKIISKWGLGGLWQHETFELPANYGKHTSYYAATDPERILNWFLKFARSRGADNARPRFKIEDIREA